MFGYLIPCDGGPPIGLSKPKLTMRLRSQSAPQSGTNSEIPAELLFADGRWSVTTSSDGPCVEINGVSCKHGRLMPDDVLMVGRHRYRVSYRAPESSKSAATVPTAPPVHAPPTPIPSRPVENPVLGMLIPCAGGRPIMLRKQKVVIGRAANCDVVIANRIVSSRHCELEFLGGYWQAVDLESRNGMFVDGMGYRTKWIFPGNILGVSTQRFRVEYVAKGERPSTRDDDVPVLSQRSLMERAGLSDEQLESLANSKEHEEPVRRRWQIDDI